MASNLKPIIDIDKEDKRVTSTYDFLGATFVRFLITAFIETEIRGLRKTESQWPLFNLLLYIKVGKVIAVLRCWTLTYLDCLKGMQSELFKACRYTDPSR